MRTQNKSFAHVHKYAPRDMDAQMERDRIRTKEASNRYYERKRRKNNYEKVSQMQGV